MIAHTTNQKGPLTADVGLLLRFGDNKIITKHHRKDKKSDSLNAKSLKAT